MKNHVICVVKKKHFQYNCPKFCYDEVDGKGIACQFKIQESRDAISNELSRQTSIKKRTEEDTRCVLPNMPKKIRGLQIHNKYFVKFDPSFINKDVVNICIECTVIDEGGLKNDLYTKVLFRPSDVSRFVLGSNTNLVISWMTV